MERRRSTAVRLGAIICVLVVLSGCMFLPKEENRKNVPTTEAYEGSNVNETSVKRGDVKITISLSASYRPLESESLSIRNGSLPFVSIFCGVGDSVEAGQVIMEQDCTAINKKISTCEQDLTYARIRLNQLIEMRDLKVWQQQTLISMVSSAEAMRMQKPGEIYQSYASQIHAQEDRIEILEMQLEELLAKKAERQIVAGMSGTITYLAQMDEKGYLKSPTNRKIANIANAESSCFVAETDYYEYFWPGDVVTMKLNGAEVEAKVIDYEGVCTGTRPAEPVRQKEKKPVYFELILPDPTLESGDRGTVTYVLASSEDTLYVSTKAIVMIDGKPVVFYQTEDGVLAYKTVETGLSNNTMTEILSGLEEGDIVVNH